MEDKEIQPSPSPPSEHGRAAHEGVEFQVMQINH